MDEDLKIVLTSELEADEQASAQRISAQLPNIAKLINSKSSIKVGVALDESNIQAQTQKLTQQITKATKTQGVGVSLSLDQSSVAKIKTELNNLKVSPDISRAMTDQLDKMGIQIDRITGRWESVNGEEERMLNLTIQGTDQMQRTVTYLQTYDTETGEINTHLTNVTANLEKQRNVQEQLAKQAAKDNESRISYLITLESKLDSVRGKYSDINAPSAIKNQESLDALNSKYQEIADSISRLKSESGKLSLVDSAEIKRQITELENLAKAYKNFESAGTKLRKKDVEAIKVDQNAGLDKLEAQLKNASILTDEFQDRIAKLKNELSNVSDSGGIRSFLDGFDALKADANVLQEEIRGLNSTFRELAEIEKEIASVQNQMDGGDESSVSYAKLYEKLELLNAQKVVLEQQIASNKELVQYSSQAAEYEMARLDLQIKTAQAEEEVANAAKEINSNMSGMEAVVQNIEARFRSLSDAPTELTQKVSSLESLLTAVSDASDDREKIEAYQRLKEAISGCNKEITQLLGVQRMDIQEFKFTENLEKAKADLATIGRQWSALFSDGKLQAAFNQLESDLSNINNQADLSKWTAEFNRFKSEVKAAGKNAQSFFDVLKNSINKVAQWGLATFSIYNVLNRLKSAVNIVIDLDTAMVDLRKTTDETEATYNRFYSTANETAKKLGVTTAEVIAQTAEWSRLGYSMAEAAKMAEDSAIFAAISPELNTEEATDGLISIMKAFDLEADEVLDGVISKINKIGNEMAVSNADMVNVMTRASASMSAANNTFDQTIALATAAVEITRNAEQAGNALRTISMRIRGYSEETEEYSEDIAQLTGEIADLTKVASNSNRGISIFEAGNAEQYRSTYDILKDIADIWDELTDKNQAQLLEVLFGKQRAQVGAAILSNFESAESAITKMQDATGNAMAEMDKIYDSLEYKLNSLQETWVGVAQSLLNSDALKFGVDAVNGFSSAIARLIDVLGPFGTALAGVGIAAFIKNLG